MVIVTKTNHRQPLRSLHGLRGVITDIAIKNHQQGSSLVRVVVAHQITPRPTLRPVIHPLWIIIKLIQRSRTKADYYPPEAVYDQILIMPLISLLLCPGSPGCHFEPQAAIKAGSLSFGR